MRPREAGTIKLIYLSPVTIPLIFLKQVDFCQSWKLFPFPSLLPPSHHPDLFLQRQCGEGRGKAIPSEQGCKNLQKFSFGCSWHWTNLTQRQAARTAPCGCGAGEVNGVVHPIINPSCPGMATETLPRAGCGPRHLQLAPGGKRTKPNCTGYSRAC